MSAWARCGVLSLRTPVGARSELRAAGGSPLRATPPLIANSRAMTAATAPLLSAFQSSWRASDGLGKGPDARRASPEE